MKRKIVKKLNIRNDSTKQEFLELSPEAQDIHLL